MDEMQQQPEQAQPEGEHEMTPINPELPPEAQDLIDRARKAVAGSREMIAQSLEQAEPNSVPKVAALLAFTVIQSAQESSGPVDPELIFMTEGVGDYLLDVIFAIAQQAGIPGADDVASYNAAQDALDEMGESFGVQANEQGEPPQEQAQDEQAPPPRGRPLMAQE